MESLTMEPRVASIRPSFTPVKASIATIIRRSLLVFTGIYSAWERVQVSRHGAYTARRVRALERYLSSTSLPRVLAVCILTPLPILAFVLLQELIPLDAPQPGWRANYRWFIRSTAIFMVLTLSYIRQGVIFLAPLKVSKKQALVIIVSTTAAYFIVLVAVSTYWIFPIPFACVLTTGVFTIVFFGLFATVIGWRTLTNTPRLSAHARIWRGVLMVETVIVCLYPAFNAGFQGVHGAQQLVYLCVLFLLKVAMRFVMAYALRRSNGGLGVEERWRARLPEVVVFSTELFHVLYLTACLQGQHITVWATIGLSLFDSIGSMVSVRHLLRRPSVRMIPKSIGSSSSIQGSGPIDVVVPVSGPTLASIASAPPQKAVIALRRHHSTGVYSSGRRLSIVIAAGIATQKLKKRSSARSLPFGPSLATIDSQTSLNSLRRRYSTSMLSTGRRLSKVLASSAANLKLARRSSVRSSGRSLQSTVTRPRRASKSMALPVPPPPPHPHPSTCSAILVAEVPRLETLSMTEYFLLVEYVKCIIPVMYGIFQVVVARLPNAIYYPSLANATPLDLYRTRTNMAVFVSIEVFSLAAFVLLLNRRLHFSVLHQLAFVLETAADDIQAKLAMFIPYCFFFFLQHNGVDYTFQFAWRHHHSAG